MSSDEDPDLSGKELEHSPTHSTGYVDTPPPRQKIDLHDTVAVRREIAAVYRDARNGHIDPTTGTRLVFMLSVLLRAFEGTDLQGRLEAMERTIGQRKKK